jgi:PTS system nitrogen regulatory IIA component
MPLANLIRPDLVLADLPATHAEEVLALVTDRIASATGLDAASLRKRLAEREELGSTGIGGGVAIPHCRMEGIDSSIIAVGVVPAGVDYGAVDHKPVKVFFVIVSPKNDPSQNLRCLAEVSRWVKEPGNIERLLEMPSKATVLEALVGAGTHP